MKQPLINGCLGFQDLFHFPLLFFGEGTFRFSKIQLSAGRIGGRIGVSDSAWGFKLGTTQKSPYTSRLQISPLYIRSTPHPVTVTTRIITFLIGNPYKPSFVTVTGWGVDPTYTLLETISHQWYRLGSKYWWNQGLALIQGQIYNFEERHGEFNIAPEKRWDLKTILSFWDGNFSGANC